MSKPSQVARMLTTCINVKIPFFMSGPVGAGKSQVAQQVCDKLKIPLTDVRLSLMDPTDIKGFPAPNLAKGIMHWLPADFLPTKGKGLLFLDELNSAPIAVQASAYSLILDRKVGNYTLPPGWAIGGAGNRAADRSIVNRMSAALANRLVHVDYDVDLDDWVNHAYDAGINAELIAFLRFKSILLHSFDATVNPLAFPTPRSWFTVDKIMKQKLNSQDEMALIEGAVGKGAAIEHAAFMRVAKQLPSIDEIMVAPTTTIVPSSPAAMYALVTSLGMATTPRGFSTFMLYVERMAVEWQVVYIRDCLGRVNEITNDPAFTKWGIANKNVVL